eukprot:6809045-Pyramimonas_sp.AAC.1
MRLQSPFNGKDRTDDEQRRARHGGRVVGPAPHATGARESPIALRLNHLWSRGGLTDKPDAHPAVATRISA